MLSFWQLLRLNWKVNVTGNVIDMNRSPKHIVATRQQDQNMIRSHMANKTKRAVATASRILWNLGRCICAQLVRNRLKAVGLRATMPYVGTCITISDHSHRWRLALARCKLKTTRTGLANANHRLRKLPRRRYLIELRRDIFNGWNNLSQRLLQKFINSMQQRLLAVIWANRGHTRYWIAILDFKGHTI